MPLKYSLLPKLLNSDDKFNPNKNHVYKDIDIDLPLGESLEDVVSRVESTLNEIIKLSENKTVLVVAHGNSIRAIVKYLLNISQEDILKTEIGWCEPWIFTINENKVVDLKILNFGSESNSNLPIKLNF